MSLTDLAALFQAAGESDAVREGIQAFVEEMLIEPEKLGEEEAVAKRAFAKLLNASGGVDVARMSFDAAHAEHENINESWCDEDAKKLEVRSSRWTHHCNCVDGEGKGEIDRVYFLAGERSSLHKLGRGINV